MNESAGAGNSLNIEGSIPYGGVSRLTERIDYQAIHLSKAGRFSARMAREFRRFSELTKLRLWCDVYRTAIAHVMSLPNLTELEILSVRTPGRRMRSFAAAHRLAVFRCSSGLVDSDIIAVADAPRLTELSAHTARVTKRAIDALLSAPMLTSLDLECAEITDPLAEQLSKSAQIVRLEVGGNPISDTGIRALCGMSQLRALDIWETKASIKGIENLIYLPHLEYLSLGRSIDDQPVFTGTQIIPILEAIPSLKRVWLDGVSLTQDEAEQLSGRYEYFRN